MIQGDGDFVAVIRWGDGVPRSLTDQSSNVWMKRPERSFGSNQVLFGGMI